MRIDRLECRQFAGVTRREYDFDEHLNLLIGRNETGKSTLIDLLYSLFFEEVGNTVGKAFKDKYFMHTTGPYQVNSAKGRVCFTAKGGPYELEKVWMDKNGRCELTLPNNADISGKDAVAPVLADLLGYGKAIYDEFIFPSQKRGSTVLEGLLGAKGSENVKELASVVSRAVMETGGMDVGKIAEKMDKKISALDGNWDFSRNLPKRDSKGERGIGNKWKVGNGTILEAYYAREEAKQNRKDAEDRERAYDSAGEALREAEQKQTAEEDRLRDFRAVQVKLEKRNRAMEDRKKAQVTARETESAATEWPKVKAQYRQADGLRKELKQAERKELYDRISGLIKAKQEAEEALKAAGEISEEDVRNADKYLRETERIQARLSGMKLTARIEQLGKEPVILQNLITGEEQPVTGDVRITEAVRISIPGIADIRLTPEGADPDVLQADLTAAQDGLKAVLGKYGAGTVQELKEKKDTADTLKRRFDDAAGKAEEAMENCDWEALQAEAAAFPAGLRPSAEVKREITDLCSRESADSFCGRMQSKAEEYEKRYQDEENLEALRRQALEEVEKNNRLLEEIKDIPYEFLSVEDPDRYAKDLDDVIQNLKEDTKEKRARREAAARDLPEVSAEEYDETMREKDEEFRREMEQYRHWTHIRDVFLRLKDSMQGNPAGDIEKAFRENLAAVSADRLKLEGLNEKMATSIVSGDHPLSLEILSEGTKNTISLAFRLAVLQHLYPEGGAVAVFDDPFTDMDPDRVREACALIRKFAEKNQVIFVTCDDKYRELLGGKVLETEQA